MSEPLLTGPGGLRVDAASVLRAYVLLLFAVPAALGVAALGTAGSPATILSMTLFLWWMWHHLQRRDPLGAGRPLTRIAALVLLFVVLVVYLHGVSSGILPTDESSPADSGLLRVVGLAGLVLVAGDGISTSARLRAVITTVVIAAGAVAVLAMIQSVTKQPWVDRINLPGLVSRSEELYVDTRNGFARPSGTATHPIEFGVTMTMALPLVATFALHSRTFRWGYRVILGLVAFAIFLSISRSAILCAAAALLVMAVRWSWKTRLVALGCVAAMVVVVGVVVPGLLGTITALFTGISEDNSAASRTGSYDVAALFVSHSPWLGRGFGTFLPRYQVLDNAYLMILIDSGIVGLAALLAMIGAAAFCAARAARLAAVPFDAEVAQSLLAGIVAGAVGFAFFDGFAFPQAAGTWFLLMGLAGASWRICRAGPGRLRPVDRPPARTAQRS